MRQETLASIGLEAGMTRAAVASRVLKTALRGLLVSTVVGGALVALGWALESIVSSFADAKKLKMILNRVNRLMLKQLQPTKIPQIN